MNSPKRMRRLPDYKRNWRKCKVQVQNQYKEQIAKLRNGYQIEIQKAINDAEKYKDESAQKDMVIERQKAKIGELDRIVHSLPSFVGSGTRPSLYTQL